ncbi:MAG: biotin/lipoyl-containing protein, partial [Salegentibacter sp.]
MAKFELKLPKMGESVAEATITSWLKEVGDTIEADEPVLEIATDKVDSEVPSEVDGKLVKKLFEADDVVQVGQTIAIIETEGEVENDELDLDDELAPAAEDSFTEEVEATVETAQQNAGSQDFSEASRFYSPLVKNIAKEEGISLDELEKLEGSGKDGRVTKNDILDYVENRSQQGAAPKTEPKGKSIDTGKLEPAVAKQDVPVRSGEDEIIEMSRMGKMIAHHMVESAQTSAHV